MATQSWDTRPVPHLMVHWSSWALAEQCQLRRGLQAERGWGSSLRQPQLSTKDFTERKKPHTLHAEGQLSFLGWCLFHQTPAGTRQPELVHIALCPPAQADPTPHSSGFAHGCVKAGDMLPACSFPDLPGFPSSRPCSSITPRLRLSGSCLQRGDSGTAGAKHLALMGSNGGAWGFCSS